MSLLTKSAHVTHTHNLARITVGNCGTAHILPWHNLDIVAAVVFKMTKWVSCSCSAGGAPPPVKRTATMVSLNVGDKRFDTKK